jgi:hypothetical protein
MMRAAGIYSGARPPAPSQLPADQEEAIRTSPAAEGRFPGTATTSRLYLTVLGEYRRRASGSVRFHHLKPAGITLLNSCIEHGLELSDGGEGGHRRFQLAGLTQSLLK